ncbi:unnamed protein product [Caenorhabditis brenneri]
MCVMISLLKLCIDKIAECVSDGTLPPSVCSEIGGLKTQLFQNFVSKNRCFPRTYVTVSGKSIHVTDLELVDSFTLDADHLSEDQSRYIHNQILKTLHIRDIPDSENGFLAVIEVFQRVLNERCQQTLEKLSVRSMNMGYIRQVGRILPSLTVLDVHSCRMHPYNLENLAECFPNLVSLNIGSTGINSLAGIHRFHTLVTLNVMDNYFPEQADVADLAQLNKLQELNISQSWRRSPLSRCLQFYLDNDIVLPELRVIECSGNDNDIQMVQKLVETHLNLETLFFLTMERSSIMRNYPRLHNVIVLEDLKSCKKFMKLYSDPINHGFVHYILISMNRVLMNGYEGLMEKEVLGCFNFLIDIVRRETAFHQNLDSISICLRSICRKERINQLPSDIQQHILNSLISLRECESWGSFDIVWIDTVWNVSEGMLMVVPIHANIDELCKIVHQKLIESFEPLRSARMRKQLIDIFVRFLNQMSDDACSKMFDGFTLIKELELNIDVFFNDETFLELLSLVKVLINRMCHQQAYCGLFSEILFFYNDYNDNKLVAKELMILMEQLLLQSTNNCGEFLKLAEDSCTVFVDISSDSWLDPTFRRMAISYSYTVFVISRVKDVRRKERMLRCRADNVHEIMKRIAADRHHFTTERITGDYLKILTSCSELIDVVDWGNYMFVISYT